MNVPVLNGIAIRRNCLWLALAFLLIVRSASGQALPTGWTDADIGSPGIAGSAAYTNGGWTVSGGGTDIYANSDKFNFASTAISGDATIVAKVTSLQNSDPGTGWSKVGIM